MGTHVRCVGDASFKKEEEKGRSMRGSIYVRAPGMNDKDFGTQGTKVPVHIIDFQGRGLRLVTRATFSSELFALCDTADGGILLGQIMHELQAGVTSKSAARDRREQGGFAIPMVLYTDAQSVYAAVVATHVKPPADKGLYQHVQYIRELLDNNVFAKLFWIDTRDMIADGLTKGVIERQLLHDTMEGAMTISHEFKAWSPPKRNAIKV